jgi:hypothetical protein
METNVKIVAWLYIVLDILALAAGLCVSAVVFGGGLISQDDTAITVTGIIALVMLGFFVVLAIPGLLAGIGLLSYQKWARILAIILAVLNLLNIPVGTALGVYTLYVLLDDETSALFNS